MHRFEINSLEIKTDKLPAHCPGFKFAFMSDLHSNEYKIDLDALKSELDSEAPDAVLIGGDMINKRVKDDPTISANLIADIASAHRVFYALGNHEYQLKVFDEDYNHRFRDYSAFLKELGVSFLDDEDVLFEKEGTSIRIFGLSLDFAFYMRKYEVVMGPGLIKHHIGNADKDNFNLLLAHNPKYFENYAEWGADLVLSGHVHGGIIRLGKKGVISPDLKLFPYFDGGMYECDSSRMLLSRGIGTHSIPIRINNRPELNIVSIVSSKALH